MIIFFLDCSHCSCNFFCIILFYFILTTSLFFWIPFIYMFSFLKFFDCSLQFYLNVLVLVAIEFFAITGIEDEKRSSYWKSGSRWEGGLNRNCWHTTAPHAEFGQFGEDNFPSKLEASAKFPRKLIVKLIRTGDMMQCSWAMNCCSYYFLNHFLLREVQCQTSRALHLSHIRPLWIPRNSQK